MVEEHRDPERTAPGPGASGAGPDWKLLLEQLRMRGPGYTRYLRAEELGRGGMGVVHTVFDKDVRRSLAMKVVLPRNPALDPPDAPGSEARALARFLEEAQVTGQLEHPGIVPVHELGIDAEDRVYFTMKLVKGETLVTVFERARDKTDERWNQTRVLAVLLRVCEAMAYAHSRDVVHRDLKPGNVMVGEYGEVYVMDWGLARVLSRPDVRDLRIRTASDSKGPPSTPDSPLLTLDGDVIGTPAYMPPEQAAGQIEQIGPHSDIYALGAMLYHLLAGDMPHVSKGERISPRTLLGRVQRGPPVPIRELVPEIQKELGAIVERAMAPAIADRYASMNELADDLRAYLEGRVVRAYESGVLAEVRKWVARNRGVTVTGLAAVLLIAGLTLWFILNLQVKERRARESTRLARAESRRADVQAELATSRAVEAEEQRRKLLRVSDRQRLDDLVASVDDLWPARPERSQAFEAWLEQAGELLSRQAEHERTLAELRVLGRPQAHAEDGQLGRLRADPDSDPEQESRLAARIERERDFDFGGDVESKWWHDTLRDLIVGIEQLAADDPYGQTVRSLRDRLAAARSLGARSLEQSADEWDQVIAEVGDPVACPAYGGLVLAPQLGLVPIGRDIDSGLFEFWHVQSGERPQRSEDGTLQLDAESGIVLVLVPGGPFSMGAQANDPARPGYDPLAPASESDSRGRLVEVLLDPFLLSKYELTQAQWTRIAGSNPSFWSPEYRPGRITLVHPVEQVSWEECFQVARQLDLVLPTEAQWEYACRAGTETPWQTGESSAELFEYANLKDADYGARFDFPGTVEPFADGFPYHAPVGSLRPNWFGFHDMHGNVWEWCRDGYGSYDRPVRPGDGLSDREDSPDRTARGGGFDGLAAFVRSTIRFGAVPSGRDGNVGVRFARSIE